MGRKQFIFAFLPIIYHIESVKLDRLKNLLLWYILYYCGASNLIILEYHFRKIIRGMNR